jgi:hypothetical protein
MISMTGHFSELDGTTFQIEIQDARPVYYMAIRPFISFTEQSPDMVGPQNLRTKSYKLVGVSGDVAFYDRVVDVGELEPR